VRALIEAGEDVNKATDDGATPLTPLFIAAHFGNAAIVQILNDAGAV
jgi:ankyrin repeat protein